MDPQTVTFGSFFNGIVSHLGGSGDAFSGLGRFATHLWLWIIILGYVVSFVGLVFIVWALMRLFELRALEKEYYHTLVAQPESARGASPRWARIKELVGGGSPSQWREAIIEADIMLDDLLAEHGYMGDGVAEKLRQADPARFTTLRDAQEAHGVRNRIAHQGSLFDLSPTLAGRTIARYEAVFREFGAV